MNQCLEFGLQQQCIDLYESSALKWLPWLSFVLCPAPAPGRLRWQPCCCMEIYVLMALHRWENSFCLAAFTVVTALFFSYMNTTNCSIFSNASCDRFAFSVPTLKKANATVGNTVRVFQASSFSFPAKE